MSNHVANQGPDGLSVTDYQVPRTGSSPLSLDDIFHILSVGRRRNMLLCMDRMEEPIQLREIVDFVAAQEYGRPIDQVSSSERHTVYVSIKQCHLPKLLDASIVEQDREGGPLRLGGNAEIILSVFDRSTTPPTQLEQIGEKIRSFVATV